ncbi:hypothetical protein G7054_g13272 [Neopestalotiopsis clavispora]|nr:hypothetical protein G7054_g13272 [Neopestalotiopsis clavispora]
MAPNYGNNGFSPTNEQEHHPLNDLSPAYTDPHWLRSNAHRNSQDADYDSTSYLAGDVTNYHGDDSATSLTESAPAMHNPSASSTHKLVQAEIVSDITSSLAQFTLRDWQWEISASIFSLGCFAAIVGVLATYDAKSLASWNFVFGITLNTLIAILSTLSRSTLLVPVTSCISQLKWIHLVAASRPLREVQVFDDASRGPWGSLELIWKLHIKTKLATWGSVITILTLAMGPFTQQLLSYPSRSVVSGTATYYTGHIYDSAWGQSRTMQIGGGRISSTMGPKMQGAILSGLFNLSYPVQFTCTTGNCRWDQFSTLAVTSSCHNVTSDTTVMCGSYGAALHCNYTTPAGFFIESSSWMMDSESATLFNYTAFEPSFESTSRPINSTLARFALANLQGNFNMSNPVVLECDIRLCARVTRNLTVTNGTLDAGISDNIELEGVPGLYEENLELGVAGVRDWYTFNITGDHPTFPGNRTFSYHMIDIEDVKLFLYDIFTSSGLGEGIFTANELEEDFFTSSKVEQGVGVNPYYWPLADSSDRSKTVADISQSMSYAIAQAPSGEKLEGKAFVSELYIRVQWPWIILPLAEVVMSISLLVCTLAYTRHKGVPAWKSSGIVPLLTVMVGWDNSELRAASARDVEKRSQYMRGQLVTKHGDVQAFCRTD